MLQPHGTDPAASRERAVDGLADSQRRGSPSQDPPATLSRSDCGLGGSGYDLRTGRAGRRRSIFLLWRNI